MYTITDIKAESIKDSRGVDTLKVTVFSGNISDSFSVPSGASTGKYEAYELRDDETSHGGVQKAIKIIETKINASLLGMDITNQQEIDDKLCFIDGTENKKNIGGNSTIGVSIACAKVAAKIKKVELFEYLKSLDESISPSRKNPYLYINLINGGKHAKSPIAFQEYHLIPKVDDTEEAIKIGLDIQKELRKICERYYPDFTVGDEGGFAINETNIFKPLDLLTLAIINAGYEGKCFLALDVAASSFYDEKEKKYNVGVNLPAQTGKINKEELTDIYKKIIKTYHLLSIEDPYEEGDSDSFTSLQEELKDVRIVGDDLTVTNVKLLKKAIENKSIKAIIIKPNQIGTLTETINTIKLARENNIDCIVSHRSGETMDSFIADLVYAFSCFGIKAGAFGPKEREAKYIRLKEIAIKIK